MKSPKIEMKDLALSDLAEDPNNPNHMSAEQLDLLTRAVREQGFLQPVLVRPDSIGGYVLIDGHHRARAAQEVGMSKVPAIIVHVDESQASLLKIGMNKLRGELDLGEVATILTNLHDQGWDMASLALSGFNESELDSLFASAQPEDTEDILRGSVQNNVKSDGEDLDAAPDGKTYVLELVFASAKERNQARQKLRKVLGPGHELGEALLALLNQESKT